jgi:hypothetical protein
MACASQWLAGVGDARQEPLLRCVGDVLFAQDVLVVDVRARVRARITKIERAWLKRP